MSGIAGMVTFGKGPIRPGIIGAMVSAMDHKTSGRSGTWVDGIAALGCCEMLSTEEAARCPQPLTIADGDLTVVMDGFIENLDEVRDALLHRGERTSADSDTEIAVLAYRTWGPGFLERLDGEFAIAIWDRPRQALFCARDRFGIRPFYYFREGSNLIFASEIAALHQVPWVKRTLDQPVVAELITDGSYSFEETVWTGIRRLKPAHSLRFTGSDFQTSEYWSPNSLTSLVYPSYNQYVEHYRDLLFETVRRYSRSSGPVFCDVSGGLDSSAIFAVAESLGRRSGLLAPGVEGCAEVYDPGSGAYETDFARNVGSHLGRSLHEIEPATRSPEWLRAQARTSRMAPPGPTAYSHLGILNYMREQESRVLLAGVGGDEWLNTNRYGMAAFLREGDWRGLAGYVGRETSARGWPAFLLTVPRYGIYPFFPTPLKRVARSLKAAATPDDRNLRCYLSDELQSFLADRDSDKPKANFTSPHDFPVDRGQILAIGEVVVQKEMICYLTALSGTEARLPYYARKMVEFSLSTPPGVLRHGLLSKSLHRDAMRGILPESVRTRSSYAEFTDWFVSEIQPVIRMKWWREIVCDFGWTTPERLENLETDLSDPYDISLTVRAVWGFFSAACLAEGAEP